MCVVFIKLWKKRRMDVVEAVHTKFGGRILRYEARQPSGNLKASTPNTAVVTHSRFEE